jgi:predicted GH43/DUF377 family glycosyl hydrolase
MKAHHIPVESIPPYRGGNAFNCSIVEHQGKTRLFFRYEPQPPFWQAAFNALTRPIPAITALWRNAYTKIGVVDLASDLSPIPESLRTVKLQSHPRVLTLDDPRVIVHDDELFLVHSRCWYVGSGLDLAWSASLNIDRLHEDLPIQHWTPRYGNNVDLRLHPKSDRPLREKNWAPFSADGELRFVYNVNPLVVIGMDLKTGLSHEISRQPDLPLPKWRWGEISGGTPLLPWRDGFAGFFHSKKRERPDKNNEWTYYAGFYAISGSKPHQITHISAVPLLAGASDDSFDRRPPSAKIRPVVVYPCGWMERNGNVLISAGWNDSRCVIYELTWDEVLRDVMEVAPSSQRHYRARSVAGAA